MLSISHALLLLSQTTRQVSPRTHFIDELKSTSEAGFYLALSKSSLIKSVGHRSYPLVAHIFKEETEKETLGIQHDEDEAERMPSHCSAVWVDQLFPRHNPFYLSQSRLCFMPALLLVRYAAYHSLWQFL